MDESKSKTKGVSIAMIILAIVIGFGFVIGLTQTSGANSLNQTKSEISNYSFDENGTLLNYSGALTELEIPRTYSLSNQVEEVQMSSTSLYTLVDKANNLNIKSYKIENLTGYQTDDFGNQYYQEKYTLTYTRRSTIEGTDYEVRSIGNQAFYNNNKITKVILPDTVKSINSSAFAGCTQLRTVEFSENLERIENSAFFNCNRLTNVVLPDTIMYMGPQAFSECDSINTINIPTSMNSLSSMVFAYCDGLTDIVIPSNIQQINSEAFSYCRNLRNVTLNEGLGYIGTNAFYYCRALTKVDLPSSVYYISHQAFWNCTNLRTVVVRSTTVPDIDSNAFYQSAVNIIYVQDEIFDQYFYYGNWSNYQSKLARISEYNNGN